MAKPVGRQSDRSYLSIREVLDSLVEEFPDVTISKIRFLESRGLIHPERTPSGYRKFYEADVERLRWILRQQREHFLPLKVIKGRLEASNGSPNGHLAPSLFDEAGEDEFADEEASSGIGRGRASHPSAAPTLAPDEVTLEVAITAAVGVEVEEEPVPEGVGASASRTAQRASAGTSAETDALYSRTELAAAAGATESLIAELEEYGLVAHRNVAGEDAYDAAACMTLSLAQRFLSYGIEARHLKMLKHAAEREAGLFTQVVTPLLLQRNPTARDTAEANLAELTSLGAAMREVFMNEELRGFTRG